MAMYQVLQIILCGVAALGLISCKQEIKPTDINTEQDPIIQNIDSSKRDTVSEPVEVIHMDPVYQNPDYPNGCEIASLSAVLNYYGIPASMDDLSDYLITEDIFYKDGKRYGPDPNEAYANTPDSQDGWYCYEGPLTLTAKNYLDDQEDPMCQQYIASASMLHTLDDLYQYYLAYGVPPVIWITTNYDRPVKSNQYSWYLSDGTLFVPYINIHCVVLLGIDYEENIATIMDPLIGAIQMDLSTLTKVYEAVGSRSMIIESIQ